jgi:hypothetical protein
VHGVAVDETIRRYGYSGTGDESDAFRHFVGAFLLSRAIGSNRAMAILNANEVSNGTTASGVNMDMHNNWTAVSFSANWNLSATEAFEYARSGGCLVLTE